MSIRKALVLVALVTILLLVSLAVASCGSGSKQSNSTSPSTSPSAGGSSTTINGYLNQLDTRMNSVSPNDFNDSQLNSSAVGL